MPHLSEDYVHRFLRLNAACRDLFESQLSVRGERLFYDNNIRMIWRHADLFLAGFPRVGIKRGYDVLCHFTINDPNRSSGLVGYVKGIPEMVPDQMDQAFIDLGDDYEGPVPDYCTARDDRKVLTVPAMPPNWSQQSLEGGPSWLRHNINDILTDDGTPEGVFERAQLLIWSSEPVNLWHAAGYGNHSFQLNPEIPDDFFNVMDKDGLLEEGTGDGQRLALPQNWLPHVEQHLPEADLDQISLSDLSADKRAAFKGKPCSVVRFYTFSQFYVTSIYEVTVWVTEDVWHSEFRAILEGKGGAIP